ncbi:hypothetical protein DP114_02475 [Brasilonema sennae CENA114]|uniref:Uncharacterized protein n=1 Tax=Brasilonema sennae CENA114 TaxID=415709 RepID=A0A856MB32_9CYAN|nr:hypothetical protein DP114_02475 [Brasilonema sennae CENA114]
MHASPLARGEPDSQSPQRGEPQRQIPLSGNPPAGLAPQGAALGIGASCHNALNPTPFGFASRLRRETLLQRWSHQIPLSGNPHQVLAPSGFTSRLRRETRLRLRSAPYACGTATP